MINQILSTNSAPRKAFNDFMQPQNGYYLPAKEAKKRSYKLAATISLTALAIGGGAFAILSGHLPKGITKYLDKLKIQMEQKAARGGRFKNFYHFSVSKLNSFIQKSESVNNFTTLKDILFQRLMWGKDGSRTFTRKIHEGITRFFDRVSRNTVNSAYAHSQRKFAGLNEYFGHLNEKILAGHPEHSEVVNSINSRIQRINSKLDEGFGINARQERLAKIRRASDGLFDYFWNASIKDIRNFKSPNMYSSYIAEDFLLPSKKAMAKEAGTMRRSITHNIYDTYKASTYEIADIQKFVSPSDKAVNDILNSLRVNLNKYQKLSGKNETAERLKLNDKILGDLGELSSKVSGYGTEQNIQTHIKEIEELITNSSKGELQEILSAYKKILPRNEYLKLRSKVDKTVKSLDNAIDIETNKYFDKARDLKLGSAPTDVLSMIAGVGAVGYYLGHADNRDDRISAALKYGIPAAGTIATSLYLTAKLVAGSKALALGLISGWLINKAGVEIDDLRKKYTLDVSFKNKTIVKSQPDKV